MYTKNPFEQDETISDDPSDRRSIKRRHLIYYLRVWNTDSGNLIGHVVDITTEGLMLISENPVPTQRTHNLEIRWSDPEHQQERVIGLRAETMWSRPDVNPAFFDTGFRLLDDAQAALQPIADLIQRFGLQD